MPTLSLSHDDAADRLLDRDKDDPALDFRKWDGTTLGVGATVTYSFAPSEELYDSNGDETELAMTLDEATRVEAYLDLIMDVADVTFTRIGTDYSSDGDFTFQKRTTTSGNAYTSFSGTSDGVAELKSGVVTLGKVVSSSDDWFNQRHGIHEVLHVLGLDHPSEYSGSVTYEDDAGYIQDSTQYTVMSYFGGDETGASYGRPGEAGMMLHDILALQKLYGANETTFSGDTIYGKGSNTDRDLWTASDASDKIYGSIWDTGGDDTIDASIYGTDADIDLRALKFSSFGGETDNLSIARDVVIEAAVGGSGDDKLRGNGTSNELTGNAGKDTLKGGAGKDTLLGNDGKDRLKGEDGRDVLKGGKSKDKLDGGAGDDSLNGGKGADTLDGGAGVDTMEGGAGDDLFRFGALSAAELDTVETETIIGFGESDGADRIDLSGIDANSSLPGDQAFVMDSTDQGGLTLSGSKGKTLVSLYIDDVEGADRVIEITDGTLRASDYSADMFDL